MNRARIIRNIAISIAFLTALWAAFSSAHAGTWTIGVIDSNGDVGRYCELALNGAGNAHVVYRHQGLGIILIASRVGNIWQSPDTVDARSISGSHCALAVGPSDARRVSYYRGDISALAYAGPESVNAWEIASITASADNIGQYLSAQRRATNEVSVSCRNSSTEALLLVERDEFGVWSEPQTVDPGPNRGSHADHVYRPGAGYAFSEYDENRTMLVFADPVLHANEWELGAVTASSDNIGQYLSTQLRSTGELSAACRNATAGSLLLVERDGFGAWSAPQTVDPGPNRGSYADHVYRPGAGYAFSEYDGGQTLLLFADPVLHANEWTIGVIRTNYNSGRHVSAVLAPDNRIASAFYQFDASDIGSALISALNGYGYAAVHAVDDTIGDSAGDNVYIDLALTSGWDWHLSYRNALDQHLWYAFTEAYVITAVEEDEQAGGPPAALRLEQNYPNPFNPVTAIRYAVPSPGLVRLCIYDAAGRLVRTLVDEMKLAGEHGITWNARDNAGCAVASGVYFLRLSQGGTTNTRKLVVLR